MPRTLHTTSFDCYSDTMSPDLALIMNKPAFPVIRGECPPRITGNNQRESHPNLTPAKIERGYAVFVGTKTDWRSQAVDDKMTTSRVGEDGIAILQAAGRAILLASRNLHRDSVVDGQIRITGAVAVGSIDVLHRYPVGHTG